jgi:OFA family oxalate/formate antiporter-like MFS transporter
VLLGTCLCGPALLLVTFASQMWHIYAWGFVTGLASIFIYVPAVMLPQLALPRYPGLAAGFVSAMFGLSAALVTPGLGGLLDSAGYRRTTLLVLALTLLTGAAGLAVLRWSLGALGRAAHARPAKTSSSSGGRPVRRLQVGSQAADLPWGRALRSGSFWALWLTWALQGGAGIALVTLAVGLGVSKGFSAGTALVILSAFNLTNGLSRLVAGAFSDRLGRALTISFTSVPAGLAYLLLPHVDSLAATAVLASLVGLGFGSMFAVSAPLVAECFGMANFTLIFALVMTAYGFVGSLLGPALAGYLLDATDGSYLLVFGYLGAFFLAGAVLVQFVRPLHPAPPHPLAVSDELADQNSLT